MRSLLSNPLDRWLAPAPLPGRADWLRGATFAHRGLHGPGVPENSPTAFRAAIARGLGIECDVQRSADGQAMVFHDWTLERLTAQAGPVMGQTAAQLGGITLTGGNDTIPTLRQMLDMVAGRVPLLIEVKSRRERHPEPLCLAVHRALEGYTGQFAVMSFDPRVPKWFFTHAPMIVRGLVVTEENDRALPGRLRRHLALWHARPDFLAYDVRDLPSRFAEAQRQRGMPVASWTVRSPEHRDRVARHADAAIAEGAGVA